MGHFHNLLCQEIIFTLLLVKIDDFTQKIVEMPFPLFWWSNYSFIPGGISIYFMQTLAFYLFCRKSSNKINEKSRKEKMDISTLENSFILMGMNNLNSYFFPRNVCLPFAICNSIKLGGYFCFSVHCGWFSVHPLSLGWLQIPGWYDWTYYFAT